MDEQYWEYRLNLEGLREWFVWVKGELTPTVTVTTERLGELRFILERTHTVLIPRAYDRCDGVWPLGMDT